MNDITLGQFAANTQYENPSPQTLEMLFNSQYVPNSNVQISPYIIGGNISKAEYKSANNGARVEIFPDYDDTIGFVTYAANGNIVFKTTIAGPDVGDVIIGNYNGGSGAKWDQSAGTFDIKGALSAGTIDIGGLDDSSFHVDIDGNMWLGAAAFNITTNPFAVSKAGVIRAVSGTIGGWTLGATTLTSASNSIIIDSANKKIESGNYSSGVAGSGFHLDENLLEVGNISARGLIRTALFQKSVISTVGGTLMVLDGDVLDVDMTALDNSTLTTKGNTTFSIGDILRIKDGVNDEWFQVSLKLIDSFTQVGTYKWEMYIGSVIDAGQSFLNADNMILNSCQFYLEKYGSPTGSAYAKIYAMSGSYGTTSIPTGSVLATSDAFDVSTLLTYPNGSLKTFTFSGVNKITLTANTNYVISISYHGGSSSNRLWVGDDPYGTHLGNSSYSTNGSTWSYLSNVDTTFSIYGEAVAPVYNVSRDKASVYAPNSNPTWKKGATIVNYGQSGNGGVYMTASDTNAPYISIFDHTGSPWSTINTRLRIGNLNGFLGYSTNLYGIAIGDVNNFLKYDPTNGLVISGNITLGTTNSIKGGQTAYNTGTGFFLGYDTSAYKFSIGSAAGQHVNFDGTDINIKALHSNFTLYDAVVDAAGYGDYTTIGAAVTAGALRIFVRPGSYTLTASISLSAGTVIIGTDWNSVLISLNSSYQFQLNADNIILKDIQINSSPAFGAHMITGSGNNIRIEHCQILLTATSSNRGTVNLTGNGCNFVDNVVQGTNTFTITGTSANVDRNRFTGIAQTGGTCYFTTYMSGADGLFTNNFVTIVDSGASYLGYGISISGDRTIVANNKFYCNTTNGQYAIYTSGADTKVVNNNVTGFATGIYLNSDYRQVCSGNTITDCGASGIATDNGTNVGYGYKAIEGNIIYNVGGAGIHIGTGARVVVSGNAIYDATGNGIEAYSGSGNSYYGTITSNVIGYCGGNGIFVCGGTASTGTGYVICNNNPNYNTGRGLYLKLTSSTVVGNSCLNNGTANSITDDSGCQIANNIG